jgi:sulfoxide reductase heme-binding subunit YedZ
LWLILSIPAGFMLMAITSGRAEADGLLHPTGETSARLMIFAMMIGPVADLLGQRNWIRWLLRHRRHLGVAAFGYATLHLLFYLLDMEWSLGDMLAELTAPGIWTGWLAMILMAAPALASNDAAMRLLRRNWKRVQQLAYAVAVLTLVHWIFLSYDRVIGPAIVHFAPLMLLNIGRIVKRYSQRSLA